MESPAILSALAEVLSPSVPEHSAASTSTTDAAGATSGTAGAAQQPSRSVATTPVSKERLRICMESAAFWADRLPRYACRQQNKADAWAIAAGVVAAITGLSIFPTAQSDVGTWGKVAVAAAAFLAAIFALVPRVKNYAEMAGKARELTSAYGPLKGQLLDAVQEMELGRGTDAARQALVDEFQRAKAKKDELRYLPVRG